MTDTGWNFSLREAFNYELPAPLHDLLARRVASSGSVL